MRLVAILGALVAMWLASPAGAQTTPAITNSTPTTLNVLLPATSPVPAWVWLAWDDPTTPFMAMFYGQLLQPGEVKGWPIAEPYRAGVRAVAVNPACVAQSPPWGQ